MISVVATKKKGFSAYPKGYASATYLHNVPNKRKMKQNPRCRWGKHLMKSYKRRLFL